MNAYFLSDIHLKNIHEKNSQLLLGFLDEIEKGKRQCSHLFLVGDIFDLWIGKHDFFVKRFKPLVDVIQRISQREIEVHYFEGNHDLYLKQFWQQEVGAQVHEGPHFFNLAQWVVRVEHGDEMNSEDRGYLFLRSFLRSGFMVFTAKILPGFLVSKIGEKASHSSRQYTTHQKKWSNQKILELTHAYIKEQYSIKPFDFCIAGHTHIKDDEKFSKKDKSYRAVNLGTWLGKSAPQVFCINQKGGSWEDLTLKE